jgi:hypothetical protein
MFLKSAGGCQVNVRELRTCSDPNQYASVRAVAEFKVTPLPDAAGLPCCHAMPS